MDEHRHLPRGNPDEPEVWAALRDEGAFEPSAERVDRALAGLPAAARRTWGGGRRALLAAAAVVVAVAGATWWNGRSSSEGPAPTADGARGSEETAWLFALHAQLDAPSAGRVEVARASVPLASLSSRSRPEIVLIGEGPAVRLQSLLNER